MDAAPDPAGRWRVKGGLDLDAPIEMHRALAKLVVAKRLDRQRTEGGAFFGKHDRDLALRGAMDARIRPVRLPAIEIGLRGLDRLEAWALKWGLLGAADAGFHFALPIGIADTTGQRDDAVMRQACRDRAD